MPLIKGYSPKSIGKNIASERRSGTPGPQAVAIALNTARAAFKTRNPGKRLPSRLKPKK